MEQDYEAHFEALSLIGMYDYGLCVRISLQFNFFAGALINLGSQRHHLYLPKIDKLEWQGCFAITEIAHGSNVRGIRTRAQYNEQDKCFIITTPTAQDVKWWIGNASRAHFCITFAQLYLPAKRRNGKQSKAAPALECKGVHLFIVPIRDVHTSEILSGITIGDCGPKAGLHSIDNGFLHFDRVRVPRENLLNRYSDVREDGTFVSSIKNDGRRFGAMLGELVMGRAGLVSAASDFTAMALQTAITYSANRKQFGPGGAYEIPVLDYQTQRVKLLPCLAASYAFLFAAQHVIRMYTHRTKDTMRKLHVTAAGLKAITTTHAQDILVMCRRACGGHGYSASSRLGELRSDQDVFMTFEGDNTVLLQEVARNLLQDFGRQYQGGKFLGTLKFITENVSAFFEYRSLRSTPHTDLTKSEFYLHLLSVRAYRLIRTGALRLQHHTARIREQRRVQKSLEEEEEEKNMSNKEREKLERERKAHDQFVAFNHVQQHLVDAAEAYTERKIASLFIKAVNRVPNPDLQAVLRRLSALYSLRLIEKHLGFYMLHRCISESCARKIRPQIIELCNEIAPDAVALCESFQWPSEEIYDVPLARPLYGSYFERQLFEFQLFGNATQRNWSFDSIGRSEI